jgi:hypothetical protein
LEFLTKKLQREREEQLKMKKRQKHLKKVFADWAKTGGKKPLSVIIKDILKQRKRDSSNPRISGGATLEIID